LNIVTPLLPERKNSGLNFLLENACFLGLQSHPSAGGHDQRQEKQVPGWKRKGKKDKASST